MMEKPKAITIKEKVSEIVKTAEAVGWNQSELINVLSELFSQNLASQNQQHAAFLEEQARKCVLTAKDYESRGMADVAAGWRKHAAALRGSPNEPQGKSSGGTLSCPKGHRLMPPAFRDRTALRGKAKEMRK